MFLYDCRSIIQTFPSDYKPNIGGNEKEKNLQRFGQKIHNHKHCDNLLSQNVRMGQKSYQKKEKIVTK